MPGRNSVMLALIRTMFTELNARGICYCHWKSNAALDRALQGIGDLDLLVSPTDWVSFESILKGLGFVEAAPSSWQTSAKTHHHYYGMDDPTGRLVHVDACDRVVTGGTLLKNHDLPLGQMIFESLHYAGIVPVPGRAQELVALVLRKMIESASPLEHAYLLREYSEVVQELRVLADDETRAEARELVARWLPCVEGGLFERCLQALARGSLIQRWLVGCELTRIIEPFQLRRSSRAEAFRCFAFARRLLQRLGYGGQGVALGSRGVLVAFIGPEGSGKSTLVAETSRWLAQALQVHTIHAGKPAPSLVTFAVHPFLPLLRAAAPRYRTTTFDGTSSKSHRSRRGLGFTLYAVRCAALAYDRAKVLKRAGRLRRNGAIVVCDRYPLHGLPDGSQLDLSEPALQHNKVGRFFAWAERALYGRVPTPDAVIACEVPLELALQRNISRKKRGGPEPEEFVRRRHRQFSTVSLERDCSRVCTDHPLPDTLSTVRGLVWARIAGNQGAKPRFEPSPRHGAHTVVVAKGHS